MSAAWFHKAFGPHYVDIYAHRNDAEARQCLDLLPRLAPLTTMGCPVLDLGCGDGRHLQELRNRQVATVGLDLSASLLGQAHERDGTLPLIRGDMRHLPLGSSTFEGVLSLFTAFGYFGPLADNGKVISEIERILVPNGHWFLDYFNCEKVRAELEGREPVERVRALGDFQVTETRRLAETGDQVFKDVVIRPLSGGEETRYTEEVAVFDLREMDDLARRCGLERVASAGSYSGDPLANGDRWILVYRKGKP